MAPCDGETKTGTKDCWPCTHGPGIYCTLGNDHAGTAPVYGTPDAGMNGVPAEPKAPGRAGCNIFPTGDGWG